MNSRRACSKAGELPKDQPAAARWFERAASLGLAPAQYRLGSMYEKGIGVTRDPAAAKRWYLKAAEAGNARAAHNLAVMSADPDGGEPNYLEAAKWFRKAGRTRRPRQPVQSRDPLRARARRRKGPRPVVAVVLARRSTGRRGRRNEARRDCPRDGPGLARRCGGGADEIQGGQARSSRK